MQNESKTARFTLAADNSRAWLLGFCFVLIGLNLRPIFGSLSVLLPEVMRDTGLSKAGASVLTTLPLLCLGVFAWPVPALAHRFGPERTLLGALLCVCLGTLLRATGDLPTLFLASALAGAGIAVANVLLPSLIRRDFQTRVGGMMGLYTLALCAGAAGAAALTVPIEQALGGSWAGALGVWTIPAAISLIFWLPYAVRARLRTGDARSAVGSLRFSPLAWRVTFFMGLQSSLAYIVMGWLAPMLRERGLDSVTAGFVVAVSILAQLGSSLLTPLVASRCRDQRALAVGFTLGVLAALLAMLFAPLDQVWFWSVLLGLGQGAAFALALMLIVLRAPNASVTAQLSAMAQGWGYVIASVGPLAAGLLRGWTGGFKSSALLMVLIAAAMAWSGWGAGRSLHVLAKR